MEAPISRRNAIVKTGLIVGGAAVALSISPSEQSPEVIPQPEFVLPLEEAIGRMKSFEKEVGNRLLTFEEARDYLPLLGDFFIGELNGLGVGTKLTPSAINGKSYIIRQGFSSPQEAKREYIKSLSPSDKDVLDSPPIKALMQDYPNLPMDAKYARYLIRRISEGVLGIQDEKMGIFLVLDQVNSPQIQYEGFGNSARPCTNSPAVNLRSIYLHEVGHKDSETMWQAVPEELKKAYANADNTTIPFKEAIMTNFSMDLLYKDKVGDSEMRFERGFHEFALDYFTSNLSVAIGLPYTLAYHTKYGPKDLANYKVLLGNAGITNVEAYKMYRQTELVDFLLKIAKGTKGTQFKDEQEMLNFGVKHLLFQSHKPINWEDMAGFYPGVESVSNQREMNDVSLCSPLSPDSH